MSQQPAAFTGDAATTSAANATSSATNTSLFEAARAVIPGGVDSDRKSTRLNSSHW